MGQSLRKSGYFDPDTLTMLYRAFDETWQIARNDQTQASIEYRRDRLASIIVVLADDGVRDLTDQRARDASDDAPWCTKAIERSPGRLLRAVASRSS